MKKRLLLMTIMLFALAVTFAPSKKVKAELHDDEGANILFQLCNPCKVTNMKGEYMVYDEDGLVSGTMADYGGQVTDSQQSVTVDYSRKFIFETNKISQDIGVEESGMVAYATIKNATKVLFYISGDGVFRLEIEGKNISYTLDYSSAANDYVGITISGKSTNGLIVQDKKGSIDIQGAIGKTEIIRDTCTYKKGSKKTMLVVPYKNTITLNNLLKSSTYVSGAKRISNGKASKKICCVHVKALQDDESLVYWRKVKKAKGYIVYAKKPGDKKYKRIKKLVGNGNTYFSQKNLMLNHTYSYYVKPYGKKKYKKSYKVSYVTKSKTRDNASKVTLSRTKTYKANAY